MDTEKPLVAADIKNYNYCPRIIYYVHVLKLAQAETAKERNGMKKYDEFKRKSKRNKIVRCDP